MTKYVPSNVEGNENLVGDLVSSYNSLRNPNHGSRKNVTKRDAIKDLSRAYGISQSKVSRILNGAENDGMHVYSRKGFYDSFKNETMADTMREMLNENLGVSQVAKGLGVSNKFVNSVLREYSAPIYNKAEAVAEKSDDYALESKLAAGNGPALNELESEARNMPNVLVVDFESQNAVESKPAEKRTFGQMVRNSYLGKLAAVGAAGLVLAFGLGNYSGCGKAQNKVDDGFKTIVVDVTGSENSVVDEYYAKQNTPIEAEAESTQNLEGVVSCACDGEAKTKSIPGSLEFLAELMGLDNGAVKVPAAETPVEAAPVQITAKVEPKITHYDGFDVYEDDDTSSLEEGRDYVIISEAPIAKDRSLEIVPAAGKNLGVSGENIEAFYELSKQINGAGAAERDIYAEKIENAADEFERDALAAEGKTRLEQIIAASAQHIQIKAEVKNNGNKK